MTRQDPGEDNGRTEHFTTATEPTIEVHIGAGDVTVHLADEQTGHTAGEATVDIQHAPWAGPSWSDGMNAMLNLFGEQFASQFGTDPRPDPADAVARARVEQLGDRLVIASPKTMPARNVPLAVAVHAPAGSALRLRTASADVTVTGDAGTTEITTGSGDVRLARTSGGLSVRTGSGDTEVGRVDGSAGVVTSTGATSFGETHGEVFARTGTGEITISDGRSGTIELGSGSGDLRIGIGGGVLCELDVSSTSGSAYSELDVATEPPQQQAHLRVHARTGTGDATVRGSNS